MITQVTPLNSKLGYHFLNLTINDNKIDGSLNPAFEKFSKL